MGLRSPSARCALRLLRAIALGFALLFAPGAGGAPRTPYGGGIAVFARAELSLDPREARSLEEAVLHRALFEPLYDIDDEGRLVPVLASGPPRSSGLEVVIPIRESVLLHDGRVLTPSLAALWLKGLAAPGSLAAHVILPVKGALEHLRGAPVAPEIFPHGSEHAIVLHLAAPYPHLARLFALPHAGIAAPAPGAALAGSGPFRLLELARRGGAKVAAFLEHRDGRPYVDAVELRPPAFLKRAPEETLRLGLFLGLPPDELTPAARAETHALALRSPPEEIVTLSIGARFMGGVDRPRWAERLDLALHRGRLARRLAELDARERRTFLPPDQGDGEARAGGDSPGAMSGGAGTGSAARVKLLVSRDSVLSARFVEGVQLDLLRAGVPVVIEWTTRRAMEAHRAHGEYELMLDTLVLLPPASSRTEDRLHALLPIASAYSALHLFDPATLAAFAAAPSRTSGAELSRREEALRRSAGLIPVVSRPLEVRAGARVSGVESTGGVLRFEEAFVPPKGASGAR